MSVFSTLLCRGERNTAMITLIEPHRKRITLYRWVYLLILLYCCFVFTHTSNHCLLKVLAVGVEPTTFRVSDECSDQLSYASVDGCRSFDRSFIVGTLTYYSTHFNIQSRWWDSNPRLLLYERSVVATEPQRRMLYNDVFTTLRSYQIVRTIGSAVVGHH